MPGAVTASGTIEADEVVVSSEVSGRLLELAVDEGSAVDLGQFLGRIDDALIQVQLRQSGPAERQMLEVQLDRLTLRSPSTGIVQKRLLRRGEMAAAGTPILTIANPLDLRLTLYVAESQLGRIRVAQQVAITADPFPGRTYRGDVSSISTRAEFTPRNIQTRRDRESLVFGVRVRVLNPDLSLKSGLPVDASFIE